MRRIPKVRLEGVRSATLFRTCTMLVGLTLASGACQGWADETLPLKRHVANEVVEIPLSKLVFITNVALPTENKGWLMYEKDFVPNPTANVLYVAMNPTDLPSGAWDGYTSGALLLVLQLPEIRDGGVYSFDDATSKNVYLINHYGHYGKSNQLSAQITVEKINNNDIVLSGTISIRPEDPKRLQEIVFTNQPVPKVTLPQFGEYREAREKRFEPARKSTRELHEVGTFTEGLAPVRIRDKWGYVNEHGSIVIEPRFDQAWNFSEEGIAVVKSGNTWGRIDKAGNITVYPQFDEVLGPREGLAPAKKDGKWGYIDKAGTVVIAIQFDGVQGFSEGLAAAQLSGKWGYVDKTGKWVIQPQFDSVSHFSNGLAPVSLGEKAYDVDTDGKLTPRTERPVATAQRRPLIILIERNPWLMVIGSDSPSFALYDDGLVIFRRTRKDGKPEYASMVFSAEERSRFVSSLGIDDSFYGLKDYYDSYEAANISVTDQPTNELYLWDWGGGKQKHVTVYGNLRQERAEKPRLDETIMREHPELAEGLRQAAEAPRAGTPRAFLKVFDQLVSFESESASSWMPGKVEVIVQPNALATEEPVAWPEGWPDLRSPETRGRLDTVLSGTVSYSIFLNSDQVEELRKLRQNLKPEQAFLINGRKYSVISSRVPFPGEEFWMGSKDDSLQQ